MISIKPFCIAAALSIFSLCPSIVAARGSIRISTVETLSFAAETQITGANGPISLCLLSRQK